MLFVVSFLIPFLEIEGNVQWSDALYPSVEYKLYVIFVNYLDNFKMATKRSDTEYIAKSCDIFKDLPHPNKDFLLMKMFLFIIHK